MIFCLSVHKPDPNLSTPAYSYPSVDVRRNGRGTQKKSHLNMSTPNLFSSRAGRCGKERCHDIWNTNPNVVTSFFSTSTDDLMVLICTILSKVLQNVTCLMNKISTGIKLEAGRAQPDRRGTALQYNRLVLYNFLQVAP
jgi:hypothetical protein